MQITKLYPDKTTRTIYAKVHARMLQIAAEKSLDYETDAKRHSGTASKTIDIATVPFCPPVRATITGDYAVSDSQVTVEVNFPAFIPEWIVPGLLKQQIYSQVERALDGLFTDDPGTRPQNATNGG